MRLKVSPADIHVVPQVSCSHAGTIISLKAHCSSPLAPPPQTTPRTPEGARGKPEALELGLSGTAMCPQPLCFLAPVTETGNPEK